MIFLSSVRLNDRTQSDEGYPFDLQLIKNFKEIKFETPVTFLVGENGTGKSTILEAIASGINHISVGGNEMENDESLTPARKLSEYFQFSWKLRTHKGFYLRAEDVFGFTKKLNATSKELDEFVNQIDRTSKGYGNLLAREAIINQKKNFKEKYGENLDFNSHGETFLKIFQSRFIPGGLYILDEPDTPLSFKRQLTLLIMIQEFVEQDAQFIIATHSPILISLPNSTIFSIDDGTFKEIKYKETEQFSLMRDFLNNPKSFLKHLEKS